MKISEAQRARFIISADDYGIRRTAGRILQLAQTGKLDRVAVMVNYVSEEQARALQSTRVKIDIHLDLIALLGRGAVLGDSTLWRGISFLFSFLLGRVSPKKVEAEWRAQIEKFRVLFGKLPDGLNSHEHVHYFSSFFRVFVKLGNEYHTPFVRFGKAGLLLHVQQSVIGYILSLPHFLDKRTFLLAEADSTDYLVDLNWLKSFEHLIRSMPQNGNVELVVHPEKEEEAAFVTETF
ncbi:MAG: ChbG/HpnK family deacetylase [Candidatus Moraniibacteriota bacterium]